MSNDTVLDNAPKTLAVAVIAQAFFDLRRVLSGATTTKNTNIAELRDARSFLTDNVGSWAESRTTWAEIAEIDPELIREMALAELDKVPVKRKNIVRNKTDFIKLKG